MDSRAIGKRIRDRRKECKMKQEDLAEKTNLTVTYISMIERGEKMPRLETFVSIVNALNVSADQLLMDVTKVGYEIKCNLLTEKLKELPNEDINLVCDIIETFINNKCK